MIRDCKELRDFEERMIRENKNDFWQNLALYEEMYKYARKMLAGRYEINPLDGIDDDIRLAKVINSV
jgi:hypothetical protein